ncbi:pyridoxamine 5'-phosphate oxidase family protein [Streptomyces sp. NEAU-YJ-81]|uniref:pyridoxamine 5'-phosphate oxidase family protein n=1 Tax=Streptomyces sp. NEAU-YJ-81 TaxID=2820288 RepID=UPI0035AE5CF8
MDSAEHLDDRAWRPGSDGEHLLQRRLDTVDRADRFYDEQVLDHLNVRMREFIDRQEMFFLATSDGHGECDNTFRAGPPGFLRVLDARTLAYPEYRGNGVLASLGNIQENPHVGILMVDFFRDRIGLHVNGRARVVEDAEMREAHPGLPVDPVRGRRALVWVEVTIEEAYIHCAKHIPHLQRVPAQRRTGGGDNRHHGPSGDQALEHDRERDWGTDDVKRKGGDFFGAAAEARDGRRNPPAPPTTAPTTPPTPRPAELPGQPAPVAPAVRVLPAPPVPYAPVVPGTQTLAMAAVSGPQTPVTPAAPAVPHLQAPPVPYAPVVPGARPLAAPAVSGSRTPAAPVVPGPQALATPAVSGPHISTVPAAPGLQAPTAAPAVSAALGPQIPAAPAVSVGQDPQTPAVPVVSGPQAQAAPAALGPALAVPPVPAAPPASRPVDLPGEAAQAAQAVSASQASAAPPALRPVDLPGQTVPADPGPQIPAAPAVSDAQTSGVPDPQTPPAAQAEPADSAGQAPQPSVARADLSPAIRPEVRPDAGPETWREEAERVLAEARQRAARKTQQPFGGWFR